jgi:hypothetical protein
VARKFKCKKEVGNPEDDDVARDLGGMGSGQKVGLSWSPRPPT